MCKTCTKCGEDKLLSDYFVRDKKTGRMHAQCKECYKTHRQSYYTAHYQKYRQDYLERAKKSRNRLKTIFRTNMIAYLIDKSCVECGEHDARVLEFDHVDPSQKKFMISQAVKLGYAWKDVLQELKKCQVLCANCHKRRTATQFGWYKA
jgi:5-methylcytosine-specific restriction endonuclease McrA